MASEQSSKSTRSGGERTASGSIRPSVYARSPVRTSSRRAATVDLQVTYHALDADGLREKLERGEELSLTEVAYLYESDDVGRDELAAYFEDRDPVDDGRVQSKATDY